MILVHGDWRAVIYQEREWTGIFEQVALIQIPLSVETRTADRVCPNALHLHRDLNDADAGERAPHPLPSRVAACIRLGLK